MKVNGEYALLYIYKKKTYRYIWLNLFRRSGSFLNVFCILGYEAALELVSFMVGQQEPNSINVSYVVFCFTFASDSHGYKRTI